MFIPIPDNAALKCKCTRENSNSTVLEGLDIEYSSGLWSSNSIWSVQLSESVVEATIIQDKISNNKSNEK